ncbi:MAG: OmpH family outer membrane protein [Gemmatimonadales bacterium]|nr:OmpH family outer membrane protein [Gemmatimonadales bacterium]
MARLTGAAIVVVLLAGLAAAPAAERTPAPPQGQPLRLAYINSQLILANTPGRAAAESLFTREMVTFRTEVARMQQQLDSSVAEYNRSSLVMTPAAKARIEGELRQMEQRTRQRASELEQQASTREQELTAPIMRRVNAVIEGIRAEFNYSMIFDATAQAGALVTADRSLDISPLVIQRLQAGAGLAPGGALQPSPAPPLDSAAGRPPQRPDSATRPAAPLRPRRP